MALGHSKDTYDVSSTAPHAARKLQRNPLGPVIKLALIMGVPIVLLLIWGQPALRIKYVWHGNAAAPVYSKCDYLTAFDGWKIVRPTPAINNCPLIALFPFDFSNLTGD